MEKAKKFLKRYKLFILLLVVNFIILIVKPEVGIQSFKLTGKNALEMLSVIPPIFILLGLLDVWVERELMVKFMGEGSGIVGILIAFILGSAAAGPLYAAFPVAIVLLRKGSRFFNVLIMIGAWSTTKIPMLLFEATSMGLKFTTIRFLLSLVGILAIALITEKTLSKAEIEKIQNNAREMK